jgi:hypothetical protein
MKTRPLTLFALALGLLMVSGPTFAHHGAAAYETGKPVTVQGTVTEFRFINPHCEIFVDVRGASGKVEKWIGELGGVTGLSRTGWTKSLVKPGDQITLTGNRPKNGANALRLQKVVLSDGKEFNLERGEDYAGR